MNLRLLGLFACATLAAACSSTATGTGAPDDGGANGTATNTGVPRDGTPAQDESAPPKRAFVTSQDFGGDLRKQAPGAKTGPAAGDALCQLAADAALLGGTFKAYLGTSARGPAEAFTGVGPWFLVGDKPVKVFNNRAHLSTTPLVELNRDEQGNGVSIGAYAWTGAGDPTDTCTDWTTDVGGGFSGAVGFPGSLKQWKAAGTQECNFLGRLYCFEQ